MNQKLFRSQLIIIGFLLVILGGVVGFRLGKGEQVPVVSSVISTATGQKMNTGSQLDRIENAEPPADYSKVDFSTFWKVWRELERKYYDPSKIDAQKMVHGAIQGMTSAIGDPYTTYLPPDENKRSKESLSGEFGGVGIQLGYVNSTLAVMAPLKGHAAEKADVKAGDLIIKIRDEVNKVNRDTTGISLAEAVNLIRGKAGSTVYLTFYREGSGEPEEKALTRETIKIPSVEIEYKDINGKKIAHLTLSQFGDASLDEWEKAVDDIVKTKPYGVVLDLRNNPGGYLQGAIDIASEFISDGPIVTQEGRDSKDTYTISRTGKLYDTKVVVLINKGTASAGEILAGALRDRKKVQLIGEKSFGKGTVQTVIDGLPENAGLHITIAKWILPNGDWIHEKGITPEIEAKDNPETKEIDEVLQKGLETVSKL